MTFSPPPLQAISEAQGTLPWQSGRYYMGPNTVAPGTSATLGNGNFRACPWTIPNGVIIARIGAEITAAGDAGCKLRLGIYADDGTGRPGNLVLDAGTIAGDSVAVQEIIINQPLPAGQYYLGGAVQLVTVSQPTVRSMAGGPYPVDYGTVIPIAAAGNIAWNVGGVTGALPPNMSGAAGVGVAPRVFVRVA